MRMNISILGNILFDKNVKTLCESSKLLDVLKEMEAACPDILEVLMSPVGEFLQGSHRNSKTQFHDQQSNYNYFLCTACYLLF